HYEQLRGIEPLLPSRAELSNLRLFRPPKSRPAGRAYFELAACLDWPFSHLLVVGNSAHSRSQFEVLPPDLSSDYGGDNVLLLADYAIPLSARGRGNCEGMRAISFDQLADDVRIEDKVIVLLRLILQAPPAAVFNCDSAACTILFRDYALQLEQCTH